MTISLIITGDWHQRGSSPRARTDDFPVALTAKVREVYYLAAQHDAAAIIEPGDLLDSPGAAYSTTADLALLLQETPCPILVAPGSHDMWGHNPETLPRTPYELLRRLRLFQDVSRYPWMMSEGGNRVMVTGTALNPETDRGPGDYLVPEGRFADDGRLHVHVAHGMLLERHPGVDIRHTTFREVLDHPRCPDVLVCGHWHIGFGVKWLESPGRGRSVVFVNPGALSRLTADVAEIERKIQVCLLTLFGQSAPIYPVLIPLESAKPGSEVLSREHLEAQAAREELIGRCLDLLSESGEVCFLEMREIVEFLAETENFPRNVLDEALRRIGKAREELGEGARTA